MATTLSRALLFTALLAAAPLFAHDASAQQRDGRIQVSAMVIGQAQVFDLRPDTARNRPTHISQRLSIAGVGALEVSAEPGAVTRIVPREARQVRITIDFVAN